MPNAHATNCGHNTRILTDAHMSLARHARVTLAQQPCSFWIIVGTAHHQTYAWSAAAQHETVLVCSCFLVMHGWQQHIIKLCVCILLPVQLLHMGEHQLKESLPCLGVHQV